MESTVLGQNCLSENKKNFAFRFSVLYAMFKKRPDDEERAPRTPTVRSVLCVDFIGSRVMEVLVAARFRMDPCGTLEEQPVPYDNKNISPILSENMIKIVSIDNTQKVNRQ